MGLFHSIFGIPQSTAQSGTAASKRTTFSSGKDTVSLTKGEVVKGEVTDLRSNEVTIRLEDGKTLHAKLSTAMELSIGQEAEFFVQETNDVLITLKLLSDGDTSFAEAAIDKALEASGFPKSAHAADIVRSLLDAGLPANKEMIQKMMQYSASNKDVELSTLTALMKHNLPVSKENATGLQAYRNFEHRLLGQATTLTSALSEAFSYGEVPASFTERLLSQFFGETVTVSESGEASSNIQTNAPTESMNSATVAATVLPNISDASANILSEPGNAPLPNTEAGVSGTFPESLPGTVEPNAAPRSDETVPLKQLLPESQYQAVEKALSSLPAELPEYSIIKSGVLYLAYEENFFRILFGFLLILNFILFAFYKNKITRGNESFKIFNLTTNAIARKLTINFAIITKTIFLLSVVSLTLANYSRYEADTESFKKYNLSFLSTMNSASKMPS